MLKAALLDQSFLAGVGNIYADESLWATKLHPQAAYYFILGAPAKLTELHRHIQRLLKLAISKAGTSVDSLFRCQWTTRFVSKIFKSV